MSHHDEQKHTPDDFQHNWTGGKRVFTIISVIAAIGLLGAIAQAAGSENGLRRFMLSYLTAFAFALSLSIGALFFVFIQHLTRAGWSVALRRPAEALAANMPLVAVLFIPILVSVWMGKGEVYPWAQSEHATETAAVSHEKHDATADSHSHTLPHQKLDKLTLSKRAFLNQPFFTIRWIVLLSLWSAIAGYFWKHSIQQDQNRTAAHTEKMEALAGPVALVFGISVTFGAFDLLMSLNPHWYSTMFGVYYFIGGVVGALAVITVTIVTLQRYGMLTRAINEAHYLDLGRLLFAFVFFWGYIAFSQFMLLWYANMPETSSWLAQRGVSASVDVPHTSWTYVILVLLFGHFLIPFCGLMSRHVKRRVGLLTFWAIWMLVMHAIDLYWVVMPEFSSHVTIGAIEIGTLAAVAGLYTLGYLAKLSRQSLIPLGDPRLSESIHHENVY